MKILSALYERFIRLLVAICHQIPWVLAGVALHFYAHYTFPMKIQSAFGIVEAETRLTQATQSTAFMKNMISAIFKHKFWRTCYAAIDKQKNYWIHRWPLQTICISIFLGSALRHEN